MISNVVRAISEKIIINALLTVSIVGFMHGRWISDHVELSTLALASQYQFVFWKYA